MWPPGGAVVYGIFIPYVLQFPTRPPCGAVPNAANGGHCFQRGYASLCNQWGLQFPVWPPGGAVRHASRWPLVLTVDAQRSHVGRQQRSSDPQPTAVPPRVTAPHRPQPSRGVAHSAHAPCTLTPPTSPQRLRSHRTPIAHPLHTVCRPRCTPIAHPLPNRYTPTATSHC